MNVNRVLETCLYTNDIAETEQFYASVLGLEPFSRDPERFVFFRCGQGVVLFFIAEHTRSTTITIGDATIPRHGSEGAGHVAFAIPEKEIPHWREHLKQNSVEIESEIDWPGGGHSIYFRDPAGNSIELATPNIWGFRTGN